MRDVTHFRKRYDPNDRWKVFPGRASGKEIVEFIACCVTRKPLETMEQIKRCVQHAKARKTRAYDLLRGTEKSCNSREAFVASRREAERGRRDRDRRSSISIRAARVLS